MIGSTMTLCLVGHNINVINEKKFWEITEFDEGDI